ncbi:MAG: response regulator [Candidatus Marinimicrobia bacterium]|nr:response regulator [Candidatus Neomarinimicrobiota bacterium]
MTKNRILIIDDEPNVCEFLAEYLEYKGFETKMCQSGKEALKYLESETFDAILLDLIMPEMNGLEVLEKIRLMKIMIPVIIVTGVKDKDVAEDAIKLGAADFIPKPIDLDRLEQSLIVNIKNLR